MAIKNTNIEDKNYDLNLLIKENELGTSTFLVKYPKQGGNIIMQPINQDWSNKSSKSPTSKSSGSCTTILWSTTTPCSCNPQHTSGHCTCGTSTPGTHYSHNSGTITFCVAPR